MGQRSIKNARRDLRKVLGPEVAETVVTHGIRIRAMSQILRRGFFGRWRWLIFGK